MKQQKQKLKYSALAVLALTAPATFLKRCLIRLMRPIRFLRSPVTLAFLAGFSIPIAAGVYTNTISLASLAPMVAAMDELIGRASIAIANIPNDARIDETGSDSVDFDEEEEKEAVANAEEAVANAIGDSAAASDTSSDTDEETPADIPAIAFNREAVLSDHANRISEEFKISGNLRDRVGFWFDIYTRHDSNKRVIHFARYPWIVFKIIDVTPIINASHPKRRWMRNQKADIAVRKEVLKIRVALRSVARRKTMSKLNEYEQLVVDALKPLGVNPKKYASLALDDVRVQTGQRNFFVDGLQVSPRYLGTMEKIFRGHRLPTELTRIPFVESSFNRHATSKVGAAGIWQFMDGTGRKFMLVDGPIDERRSPYKSSEGAARLLKENHLILRHSWPLAVTAWNHGPGGLRKAMAKYNTLDLGTIVERYRTGSFDFASSNFYSEFLAALHAEKYSDEVFGPLSRVPALELEEVRLTQRVRTRDLIKTSGLSENEFLLMNPELKGAASKNLRLPARFKVHVPESARNSIQKKYGYGSEQRLSAANGS